MLQITTPRFAAIANVRSGAAFPNRRRRFARLLEQTLGGACAPVTVVEPEGLAAALDRVAAHRPEALILLGGDGTTRTALERLSPERIPVAPLAGGALSRISRSVYGRRSFRQVLQSLGDGEPGDLAGGRVNGVPFYCAAGCGDSMGLAQAREALRAGRPRVAAGVMRRLHGRWFSGRLEWEGAAGTLALAAPGPVDAAFGLGAGTAAQPPAEGELAIADIGGVMDAIRLLPALRTGCWREAKQVQARRTRRATVRALDGPLAILADGETLPASDAAVFEFGTQTGLVWRSSRQS